MLGVCCPSLSLSSLSRLLLHCPSSSPSSAQLLHIVYALSVHSSSLFHTFQAQKQVQTNTTSIDIAHRCTFIACTLQLQQQDRYSNSFFHHVSEDTQVPVQTFPALNGRYQTIGVTSFYIQQKTIEEEQPCELVVKCFYPSSESRPSSPPSTPYMSVEQATALAAFAHIPSMFFTHVAKIKVRAVTDAPWLSTASSSSPLPVLIYSHGLGGMPETYQVQATHLASHGFVVLLPTHNDGSAALSILPDNRQILYQPLATANTDEKSFRSKQLVQRVRDILFLVDSLSHSNPHCLTTSPLPAFWSLLDPKQIGLIGHSFGAGTVMAAAALEQQQQHEWYQSAPRIKAVISHDQWMLPVHHLIKNVQLSIPTLITISEGFKKWDNNYSVLLRLYRSFPPDSPSLMLYIAQSAHSNFSDVGLYAPAFLARLSRQIGSIDHVYCWRIVNDCNVTWMSRWMQIPIGASVDQDVLDPRKTPAEVIFLK